MSVEHEPSAGDQPAAPAVPAQPLPASGASRPWFVVVTLWGIAGVALTAVAFALSRDNTDLGLARTLPWFALAAIAGPALMRMLAPSTGRSERILLIGMTALLLYWTKVLYDPTGLAFPDELHHLANTERLVDSGRLYENNSLLPVTADYPGLSIVTAALSLLSGIGLFTSALLVIGAAKVLSCVALYLVFERLSGSARIAGAGALLYCASSSFMFVTAQFSYESLAVALLAVVLLCVVQRRDASDSERGGWSALGGVVAVAVVMTHHLAAYALIVLLWAQVAITLSRRRPGVTAPIAIAVTATVAGVAWATFVAGDTAGRLGDVPARIGRALSRAFGDASATRAPTPGGGSGGSIVVDGAPLDDVLLALASVFLVALLTIAGVLAARRRSWPDPLAAILAAMGLVAVAAVPLRALAGAGGTADRVAELLFAGAALMAGVAAVAFVDRRSGDGDGAGLGWRVPAMAAAGAIAVAGAGAIGWPGDARLPRAFTADVAGARVQPAGPRMATWAAAGLPRDAAIVADAGNALLLEGAGFRRVLTSTPAVAELLSADVISRSEWDFLRARHAGYVVLDRRLASDDDTARQSYPRPRDAVQAPISNWRAIRRKYARLPGSARIFDGGDIVVFDIRRPLRQLVEPPPDVG
ncbi:MAG: hypothetical protein QOJ89_840 [bacterium]